MTTLGNYGSNAIVAALHAEGLLPKKYNFVNTFFHRDTDEGLGLRGNLQDKKFDYNDPQTRKKLSDFMDRQAQMLLSSLPNAKSTSDYKLPQAYKDEILNQLGKYQDEFFRLGNEGQQWYNSLTPEEQKEVYHLIEEYQNNAKNNEWGAYEDQEEGDNNEQEQK